VEDLSAAVDGFLVLDLDPFKLSPRGLFRLPVRRVREFWSPDAYQRGAGKLNIDDRFRDAAEQL
jgi:hypothetical protein